MLGIDQHFNAIRANRWNPYTNEVEDQWYGEVLARLNVWAWGDPELTLELCDILTVGPNDDHSEPVPIRSLGGAQRKHHREGESKRRWIRVSPHTGNAAPKDMEQSFADSC